jgi:hypothetical protein
MGVPATNQTLNVLKCNTYCFLQNGRKRPDARLKFRKISVIKPLLQLNC